MPNRIVFASNKGGVGKTTSTAMCAKILSEAGYKVLAVDLDNQGNLTRILTGDSVYKYTGKTIMEAIQTGDAAPYIVKVNNTLDIIPAEERLSTFSRYIYTSKIENPSAVIKRLLGSIEARYDFVFLDVGPTIGDTVVNAVVYSDYVFIPVDLGDLSMEGMVRFIEFVETTASAGHSSAEVAGILMTMKDGRIKSEREIGETLREAYGGLVFDAEIRRRARVKEIASKGIDINDPSADDYLSLTEEIIARLNGKEASLL